MKSATHAVLFAALWLLAACPLRAGSLTANFNLLGGNSPIDQVSFVFANQNYSYASGQELVHRTDLPAGLGVDNQVPADFHAFCVEVGQDVFVGSSDHYANVIPLAGAVTQLTGDPLNHNVTFDPTRTLMLERLWGGFESLVNSRLTADAFQLATWELAFDNDQTLSGAGSLMHASAADLANPSSVASIAEGWLAQVRNLNVALATPQLLLLTDPGLQDLITPVPGPPFNTPEPTSVVLLTIGALGLAFFARRRRKALR